MDTNLHAAAKRGDVKEIEEEKKEYRVCGDEESQEGIVKAEGHASTHNQRIEKENQDDGGTKLVMADKLEARLIEERSLLLVVAVLIATVTYQAAITPPPSIWKEGTNLDYKCLPKTMTLHRMWHRIWSLRQPYFPQECPVLKYYVFMMINTSAFSFATISIFFLLMPDPTLIPKGKFMIFISIISLLLNYICLILSLSQDQLSAYILSIPIYLAMSVFSILWVRYRKFDWKSIVLAAFKALCGRKPAQHTQ